MWCNRTLKRGAASSIVPDAGSHLSWVLGLEALRDKLASTAHTEINAEENRDVQRLVRNTLLVRTGVGDAQRVRADGGDPGRPRRCCRASGL